MSVSSPLIREAGWRERRELRRFKESLYRETFAPMLVRSGCSIGVEELIAVDLAEFEFALQDSHHRTLILEDRAGGYLGVASLHLVGEEAVFSGCYIREPGRGHGSLLTRARLRLAREGGCTSASMLVAEANQAALAHARRHGFQLVSRQLSPLDPRWVVIRMERRLESEPLPPRLLTPERSSIPSPRGERLAGTR